jgi:hypothetical protein
MLEVTVETPFTVEASLPLADKAAEILDVPLMLAEAEINPFKLAVMVDVPLMVEAKRPDAEIDAVTLEVPWTVSVNVPAPFNDALTDEVPCIFVDAEAEAVK